MASNVQQNNKAKLEHSALYLGNMIGKRKTKALDGYTFRVSVVRFLPEAMTFPSSTITQLVN